MELANAADLNRVGIVFNVVAGFLLAPELIGETRIRTMEQRLERTALSVSRMLTQESGPITASVRWQRGFFLFWGAASCVVLWYAVWAPSGDSARVALAALSACLTLVIVAMLREPPGTGWLTQRGVFVVLAISAAISAYLVYAEKAVLLALVTGALFAGIAIFRAFPWSWQLAWQLPALALSWPAIVVFCVGYLAIAAGTLLGRSALWAMDPDRDRFQGWFVTTGVLLFLVGNALQLLATY